MLTMGRELKGTLARKVREQRKAPNLQVNRKVDHP